MRMARFNKDVCFVHIWTKRLIIIQALTVDKTQDARFQSIPVCNPPLPMSKQISIFKNIHGIFKLIAYVGAIKEDINARPRHISQNEISLKMDKNSILNGFFNLPSNLASLSYPLTVQMTWQCCHIKLAKIVKIYDKWQPNT